MSDSVPLFFDGEFDLTLDEKSRVLVPAYLKKSIYPAEHGEAFYLVPSAERRLFMYPDRYYKQLMAQVQESNPIPTIAQLKFDRRAFGLAQWVEADKAGRILIAEKTRQRTGIDREVTFVGVGNHIEIWDRKAWNEASEGLLAEAPQIDEQARRQLRGETGMPTHTVTRMEAGL